MAADPVLGLEARLEALDDTRAHHGAAELVQRRLFAERLQQHRERLPERVRPKIFETRPRLRIRQDRHLFERGSILGATSVHGDGSSSGPSMDEGVMGDAELRSSACTNQSRFGTARDPGQDSYREDVVDISFAFGFSPGSSFDLSFDLSLAPGGEYQIGEV